MKRRSGFRKEDLKYEDKKKMTKVINMFSKRKSTRSVAKLMNNEKTM